MAEVGLYARVYVGDGKSKWVSVEIGKNGRPIPVKDAFNYCMQFSDGGRQLGELPHDGRDGRVGMCEAQGS